MKKLFFSLSFLLATVLSYSQAVTTISIRNFSSMDVQCSYQPQDNSCSNGSIPYFTIPAGQTVHHQYALPITTIPMVRLKPAPGCGNNSVTLGIPCGPCPNNLPSTDNFSGCGYNFQAVLNNKCNGFGVLNDTWVFIY